MQNPFSPNNSQACAPDGAGLIFISDPSRRVPQNTLRTHDALRGMIASEAYPCIGGRGAVKIGSYRFALYDDMESAAPALAHDLCDFVFAVPKDKPGFSTFVTTFDAPAAGDSLQFERSLFGLLQALSDIDAEHFPYDSSVSSDPKNPRYSFSFAGRAFFVVGGFAGSSRLARRFLLPTVVFNAHYQFTRLRDAGKFVPFQSRVRERDMALQGSLNPNLSEFGLVPEARQYSGREVTPDWKCPLVVKERNG